MPIKREEERFGSVRVVTQTLPVIEAQIVWFRLGKLLSPAMVAMRTMSAADRLKLVKTLVDMKLEDLDFAVLGELVSSMGPAFAEVFQKVDVNELPGLFRALFGATIAVRDETKFELGKSVDAINNAFDGDQGALWLAAFWVARHNFAGFTSGRRVSVDTPSKAAASNSTSEI